jgi:hypothetical protein
LLPPSTAVAAVALGVWQMLAVGAAVGALAAAVHLCSYVSRSAREGVVKVHAGWCAASQAGALGRMQQVA